MIELMSLQDAKSHLRITANNADDDISLKIMQASGIVFNYLKIDLEASPIVFPWSSDEIPWEVMAAGMLVLGMLFKDREGGEEILSEAAKSLLHRHRDPTMA